MGMEIVAKSRREAVKMFGLVLKHYGILYLGGIPCGVKVVFKQKSCSDTYGQCNYGMLRIQSMLNVLWHHKE